VRSASMRSGFSVRHIQEIGVERLYCKLPGINSVNGLSPQARGTGRAGHIRIDETRFIPAGAGNGCASVRARHCPSVHPRRRGERCSSSERSASTRGSSPQARGTDRDGVADQPEERFIPAGAGNGHARIVRVALMTVHPRRRGERAALASALASESGSSPQARGTVVQGVGNPAGGRFIPAGAGNGCAHCDRRSAHTVHPRRRGERHHP